MKSKISTLIASAAMVTMASAFTIDFNTAQISDGTNITPLTFGTVSSGNPVTVTVPGYGDVRFEVVLGSSDVLEVGNRYANDFGSSFVNSLQLNAPEIVKVTFLGDEVLNLNFDLLGISSGENEDVIVLGGAEIAYSYSPGNGDIGHTPDGAGIAGISWTTVPEPSSSLMVLIGAGSLILRRRR